MQLDPARTAMLLVDLQNDFLHPQGAYARGGVRSAAACALPTRLAPIAHALRRAGGVVVATLFTLVPGRGGEPLIAPHLARLRPFLGRGDFAPGSWGQQLVDELAPADVVIEKIAYSAFYMSRLEWVLDKLNIDTLVLAGITTNGGVASTLRDAHLREYNTILLEDGCAAFDDREHLVALASLRSLTEIMTCQHFENLLKAQLRS